LDRQAGGLRRFWNEHDVVAQVAQALLLLLLLLLLLRK